MTRLETAQDRFKRCAIVHGVFAHAFSSMLPVLALDACHLMTKSKGTLYVASLHTGNFDILTAGLAISNCGDRENKDDWAWFIRAVIEGVAALLDTDARH